MCSQPTFAGKIRLGKLDVTEHQELAGGIVRSMDEFVSPSVMGICSGELLDSFVGAQPPERIKQFVGTLLAAGVGDAPKINTLDSPSTGDLLIQGEEQLEKLNSQSARILFQQALRISEAETMEASAPPRVLSEETRLLLGEEQARAYCGLTKCALAEGKVDVAQQILDLLEENHPDRVHDSVVVQTMESVKQAAAEV
jgi:thioredoxin-like negative regulator of GroEL